MLIIDETEPDSAYDPDTSAQPLDLFSLLLYVTSDAGNQLEWAAVVNSEVGEHLYVLELDTDLFVGVEFPGGRLCDAYSSDGNNDGGSGTGNLIRVVQEQFLIDVDYTAAFDMTDMPKIITALSDYSALEGSVLPHIPKEEALLTIADSLSTTETLQLFELSAQLTQISNSDIPSTHIGHVFGGLVDISPENLVYLQAPTFPGNFGEIDVVVADRDELTQIVNKYFKDDDIVNVDEVFTRVPPNRSETS